MNARLMLCLWLLLIVIDAQAGQACSPQPASAAALQNAVASAHVVRRALEQRNAPAALVARMGTDLSAQGLVYSHVGVVLRDRPEGRWTVVHLLNECASDRSNLYLEGLVNFFADDLVSPQARVIWLDPQLAERLAAASMETTWLNLHQPHYNLLSRPHRLRSQNSTAWILELLAIAMQPGADDRPAAQRWLQSRAYQPDLVHVPYSKRLLGGLFAANVEFTEHSVQDRLAGRYAVTTVRSIVSFLESQGVVQAQAEWQGEQALDRLGPL